MDRSDRSFLANPTLQKFVFGGWSCMTAACFTNPIDVIKVRLQLQGENHGATGQGKSSLDHIYGKDVKYKGFLRGVLEIVKDEGIVGLYKGLFPSLLREGSYSTIRMGGYDVMKELLGAHDVAHTPLWKKIVAGATSGAVGSAIANPTDLVKVRMQADTGTPRRYASTFDAFAQIWRSEGLAGLYKGVGPTTYRATLLTASQLPSYDHSKHFILNHKLMQSDNISTHIVASMIAGFNAAVITSPVDVIKSRIMNDKTTEGAPKYKNTYDCFVKIIRSEGLIGLYKGFFPNWMRIGPHTIITFLVYEELRKVFGIGAV
eukprot:TRINITY_DN7711_c0_g1_i1.p1 TRINITY_DN7711_c0_g1~~TRINITY_DN7711_c0_g1_i1.p1  ORF type:complete len:317 (-),score=55.65 TRINITY_DN7711_c0_g1_i1:628-1578(-)